MTIKYQDKNVSAEYDEIVVTDVSLNNGVLTFARKDFYDDDNDANLTITIDLKDIKLRIRKLDSDEDLDEYRTTQDPEKILERETHLFLVKMKNTNDDDSPYINKEGIYTEYIWDENTGKFESLGSTYLNLEPLEVRISDIEDIIEALEDQMDAAKFNITSLQENKQDKVLDGKNKNVVTNADGQITTEDKPVIDTEILSNSTNAVQNKAIYNYIKDVLTYFANEI